MIDERERMKAELVMKKTVAGSSLQVIRCGDTGECATHLKVRRSR